MYHSHSLFLREPLYLPYVFEKGGVMVLQSTLTDQNNAAIDLTTIELQSETTHYDIQLIFHPSRDTVSLKFRLGGGFMTEKATAPFKSSFPGSLAQIRIHNCDDHYQFFFNGHRVFESAEQCYQNGIQSIVYQTVMRSKVPPFSNPFNVTTYASLGEYLANHPYINGQGMDEDSIVYGGASNESEHDTCAWESALVLRETEVSKRERSVLIAEKRMSIKEDDLARREREIVVWETRAAEWERDLSQREKQIIDMEWDVL